MSWVSEKEYRLSGAEATGITVNVAFLREIKTDFDFRQLLNQTYHRLHPESPELTPTPRETADLLSDLRDELETYFALEEFYGYFQDAAVTNPCVSQEATTLHEDHEKLYLQLGQLLESTLQMVYQESDVKVSPTDIAEQFEQFCMDLADHEQAEMDLMMRLCNEDIGVGD